MNKYTIYPLHLGTIVRDNSNMMYMKDCGKKISIPLLAWLVKDENTNLLVDTGGTAPDGKRYMPYTREPDQDLSAQLAKHDLVPDDISYVIMTHLHWDHAGNNQLFSKAKFFAQKSELQYAAAPLKIQESTYDYGLVSKTKYEVLNGDCILFDGISLITTPGHSPGSQSVIINTKQEKYVIVGDLIGLYACYETDPMIVNGLHTNLFEYYDSLNKVKELGAKILPGHDPKVLEQESFG